MKERGPIFYDAERVRWRRTRRVMEISAVLLTVALAYFFVTVAVSVDLPAGFQDAAARVAQVGVEARDPRLAGRAHQPH